MDRAKQARCGPAIRGTYKGLSWYRKHFKLPARYAGDRIFLEFEGMRQAGDIFLNGKQIGLYENGVTAYGVDITGAVHFGNEENVLAVKSIGFRFVPRFRPAQSPPAVPACSPGKSRSSPNQSK
jgi:beta-galactosidase/beta-glucuronidase